MSLFVRTLEGTARSCNRCPNDDNDRLHAELPSEHYNETQEQDDPTSTQVVPSGEYAMAFIISIVLILLISCSLNYICRRARCVGSSCRKAPPQKVVPDQRSLIESRLIVKKVTELDRDEGTTDSASIQEMEEGSVGRCADCQLCNICLVDYLVGDEICTSPNKDCIHAFHKECILDWLMKHNECPVCRREYIPSENTTI